ncbi:MAG: hypothetical protein QG660_1479, partial [Pseudomonadota bacterium]|nr:hypothetical protein [Pseudomonadota bacterium]
IPVELGGLKFVIVEKRKAGLRGF